MEQKRHQSFLVSRVASFGHAIRGLAVLFTSQKNAQIHGAVAVVVISMAAFFRVHATEWVILVIVISIVLAAEALNTSLEFIADRVSPEYHDLIRDAKDVAAAAVLLVSVGAVIVGAIIFLPYFFA